MRRSFIRSRAPAALLLGLTFAWSAGTPGCKKSQDQDSPPKAFELKDVGVKLTAPGDWELGKQGNRWVLKAGIQGVFLARQTSPMPATPEEAAKQFMKTQVLTSEKLPGGGIYLFYQMDFAETGSKEPKWLKYVYSIVPAKGGGTITCTVQLLADDERKLYEPVCKSMRPL